MLAKLYQREYWHLPMNKNAASTRQTILDEGIASREMFEDVVIFHVIHLDEMMLEIGKQILAQGQSQRGHDMSDIGLL